MSETSVCRWCGKKIRCLRYGHAYMWTHDDMTGRECCVKYAEPLADSPQEEGK